MSQSLPAREILARLPLSALFHRNRPEPDPAARVRRGVGRWLRRLGDLGEKLSNGLRDLAQRRFASADDEPAAVDLGLGRTLVLRALRWIAALQDRFAAEAKASRAPIAPAERPSFPRDGQLAKLAAELRGMQGRKPILYREARRDDCIDGKTVAEAVAQICADLGAAADLLSDAEAKRQIEAIAAAARAFLGEPEAALPSPAKPGRVPAPVPGPVPGGPAAVAGVAVPVGVTGTG